MSLISAITTTFSFYKNSFRERNERGGKENQTTIPTIIISIPVHYRCFPSYPHPFPPSLPKPSNWLLPYKGTVIHFRTYQCLSALVAYRSPIGEIIDRGMNWLKWSSFLLSIDELLVINYLLTIHLIICGWPTHWKKRVQTDGDLFRYIIFLLNTGIFHNIQSQKKNSTEDLRCGRCRLHCSLRLAWKESALTAVLWVCSHRFLRERTQITGITGISRETTIWSCSLYCMWYLVTLSIGPPPLNVPSVFVRFFLPRWWRIS